MTEIPKTSSEWLGQSLWDFSLERYGRAEVPPLCLHLQDRHGADVNLVLAGLWLAVEGYRFASESVAPDLAKYVECWSQEIVVPLRSVRRRLKAWPDLDETARAELRRMVQSLELRAERLEQDQIEHTIRAKKDVLLVPHAGDRTSAMIANATSFCRPSDDGAFPSESLSKLAALCG